MLVFIFFLSKFIYEVAVFFYTESFDVTENGSTMAYITKKRLLKKLGFGTVMPGK